MRDVKRPSLLVMQSKSYCEIGQTDANVTCCGLENKVVNNGESGFGKLSSPPH